MYLEPHLKTKLTSMHTGEKKNLVLGPPFIPVVPHCLNGAWVRAAMGISLSLCHVLLIHLAFHPGTFPSGSRCLAGKVALRRGRSKFQSQHSVLLKARNGECVRGIRIAEVLGRHGTIVIVKVQVVRG